MRWGRQWWIVLLWAAFCSRGTAQSGLAESLRTLPVSVGAYSVVTVPAGETWVDVGIREHVGYEHLRRANTGDIGRARRLDIAGRHQVPILTENGLVINLPELMEYRIENGKVVAWYPISIGRVTSRWHTPVGNLRVVSREVNPTWDRPSWAGGGKVPPGPRNPLGDRWIGLDRPGYGLHGTNDPTSIGRFVSHGCIRHYPADIHALYDHTSIGMPVIITYQTVTVGVDGGMVYMAVLPDIYGRGTNAPGNARKQLARYGLDGVLTGPELEQWLAQTDGIAHPMLGSNTKVFVNLIPLNTPIGPTNKQGITYLPIRPLATALDAQVAWDAGTKTITLTRGDRRVSYSSISGVFPALGTHFVPIRRTVDGLGGRVLFDKGTISIFVI